MTPIVVGFVFGLAIVAGALFAVWLHGRVADALWRRELRARRREYARRRVLLEEIRAGRPALEVYQDLLERLAAFRDRRDLTVGEQLEWDDLLWACEQVGREVERALAEAAERGETLAVADGTR